MRINRALSLPALLVVLLSALLTVLAPASAAPSRDAAAACSLTPTDGTVTRTIWVTGQGFRSYNLRVPAGLSGSAPLLLSMHGLSSNAYFQEQASGWSAYADATKFIVAYPAGSSWGQAWDVNQGSADVTFLRQVVADVRRTHCVDAKLIVAEGGSLGGMMAQRVLCDAEDLFASGVSTISSGYDYFGGTCSLSRGVAAGIVTVEGDPLFPTSVGEATRDKWLALDHCSTTGTSEPHEHGANGTLYGGCDGGVHVLWRTYASTEHAYPAGAAQADFHQRVWSFLIAHPHP